MQSPPPGPKTLAPLALAQYLTREMDQENLPHIFILPLPLTRCTNDALMQMSFTRTQGGPKLFADSDRKLSMIPDSRVLESNKSNKLAAIEILRTF